MIRGETATVALQTDRITRWKGFATTTSAATEGSQPSSV
jgi:hypothetical protein